uniref:Uncharacterized protein n=1 Tax=Anopheles gambiae TaxID=7165 RepID=A0A0E3W2B4_ANOGA
MELVEWISAIVVTIVIKISWSLRQTMESLHDRPSDPSYFTSYAEQLVEVDDEVGTHLERSRVVEMNRDAERENGQRVTLLTSTPVLSSGASNSLLMYTLEPSNCSSIYNLEQEEIIQEEFLKSISKRRKDYEIDHHLLSQFDCIRTPRAPVKLSPDTAIKYQRIHTRQPNNQRKYLRL